MSDVKLLACPNPWCRYEGHAYAADTRSQFRVKGFSVLCGCGVRGPQCRTEPEAVAAWNARPAPALTPKQAAAEEMAKALKEANAWLSRGDGLSPAKRGATCDTLNEAVEMIEAALAKAGQP